MTNTAVIPVPAVAAALTGVPHVWWLREFVTRDHDLAYIFGEALSQRVIGRCSRRVIANSHAVRRHYSPPIPAVKMRVLYQGITGFEPTPNVVARPEIRALMLGHVTPTKGVEVAVEAAGILRSAAAGSFGRPAPVDLRLRLVGPIGSDYRRRLERLIAERGLEGSVEIAGFSSSPRTELAWANVLLVCSDNEAFGRVTVEALKSGRPVVGSRSGGTPELITHGVNGLLFAPGNAAELAGACAF